MFYHQSENKLTIIIKHFAAFIALISMAALFIYVILDDVNAPQQEMVIEIDVKNKINICLPEDEAEEEFGEYIGLFNW